MWQKGFCLLLLAVAQLAFAADDQPELCTKAESFEYIKQLEQAVQASWQAPELESDYSCIVVIALNFRGEVLNVGVDECTKDNLVIRKSVEDAAYNASPLPLPANRICLDRTIRITLRYRAGDSQ